MRPDRTPTTSTTATTTKSTTKSTTTTRPPLHRSTVHRGPATRVLAAQLLVPGIAALCVAMPAFAASMAPVATATAAANGAESRAAVFAAGVAHLTGLAISPLLVLVLLGWIDFARAGGLDAATLPIHANPWLLAPCTLVLAAALAKKCVSPAIPLPVRKTLDAGEYLEAKLSALVAAGVLLPSIIATMAAATGDPAAGGVQAAGLAAGWATYLWLVPAALVVFAAVWITFHAVDGLVLLSPFAIIDTLLVALRATVLVVLGLALLASPLLALALCAPVIVLSLLFAGWCVRLDLFAMCLALDILLARGERADPSRGPVRAFLAARGHGAPIRTMGHAEPCDGGMRFTYRPFFVLPRRTLVVEAGRGALVRGALWSTIRDDARARQLVHLPPRYNRHADRIAARFGVSPRDGTVRRAWSGIVRGFRAIFDAGEQAAGA